jgi:hypothetical protein
MFIGTIACSIHVTSSITDRSSEASTDLIEMAIRDLDNYLMLFPDRSQAREVRDSLSERLSAKAEASPTPTSFCVDLGRRGDRVIISG